jgi:multidrug efflux system outer membrane protein
VFTKRYLGGTDTKISTSRADAALQASLATIAALERQIAQQENAISVLLGTNPRPIERGRPLLAQPVPVTPPGSRATCCGVAPTSARPSRR